MSNAHQYLCYADKFFFTLHGWLEEESSRSMITNPWRSVISLGDNVYYFKNNLRVLICSIMLSQKVFRNILTAAAGFTWNQNTQLSAVIIYTKFSYTHKALLDIKQITWRLISIFHKIQSSAQIN